MVLKLASSVELGSETFLFHSYEWEAFLKSRDYRESIDWVAHGDMMVSSTTFKVIHGFKARELSGARLVKHS